MTIQNMPCQSQIINRGLQVVQICEINEANPYKYHNTQKAIRKYVTQKYKHLHKEKMDYLTISVWQQVHKAIKTGVSHGRYIGCTSSDCLNCGCSKLFVLAFYIGLKINTFIPVTKRTLKLHYRLWAAQWQVNPHGNEVSILPIYSPLLQFHFTEERRLWIHNIVLISGDPGASEMFDFSLSVASIDMSGTCKMKGKKNGVKV